MTVIKVVRLWCDHHAEPAEGQRFGPVCYAEFQPAPEAGFIKSVPAMRREAAKAGWSMVKLGSLVRDFCPDHKPDPKEGQ